MWRNLWHNLSRCRREAEFRVQEAPAALAEPDQSPSGATGGRRAPVSRTPTCAAELASALCTRRGFAVLELTREQLLLHSIMSTVKALCVAKKRSTCQNAPCSVSKWQFPFLAMCECCHVRHCKWVTVTRRYTVRSALSATSQSCSLTGEVEAH